MLPCSTGTAQLVVAAALGQLRLCRIMQLLICKVSNHVDMWSYVCKIMAAVSQFKINSEAIARDRV